MLNRKTSFLATALTLSLTAGVPAWAGDQTPRLDHREQRQAQRIANGVRSGELTRPETHRLVNGQQHLRRMERHARADGDVTARERARLDGAADRQSARIYRQKHDAQQRP
jgi:hypothetical protein